MMEDEPDKITKKHIAMAEIIRILILNICCILETNITVRITASRVNNTTNKLRVKW